MPLPVDGTRIPAGSKAQAGGLLGLEYVGGRARYVYDPTKWLYAKAGGSQRATDAMARRLGLDAEAPDLDAAAARLVEYGRECRAVLDLDGARQAVEVFSSVLGWARGKAE